MKHYLAALAELFKLATIYSDKRATAILAKQLELSMEPNQALEHWNTNKGHLHSIADTLTIQTVDEFLMEGVRQ